MTAQASPALERLAVALGSLVQRDVPIGPLTTYRVGGSARLFCELGRESDVAALTAAMSGSEVPVLVIGKGSNLLVADSGWDGLCVRLGDWFASIEIEGLTVNVGAAAAFPVLARQTGAAGLSGLEWAVGIPGSVGGAVRMNAGGHGAQTRDRLVGCRIADLRAGLVLWRTASQLELSYRHSSITSAEIVLAARFWLERGEAVESAKRVAEIVRWRHENQPGGQNAGSVFVNPAGDSAGRIIDAAGLKGLRIGSASVSEKHANFIQADPSGSADDVRRLVEAVQAAVADRLGVELGVELQMVGWEPSPRGEDAQCS